MQACMRADKCVNRCVGMCPYSYVYENCMGFCATEGVHACIHKIQMGQYQRHLNGRDAAVSSIHMSMHMSARTLYISVCTQRAPQPHHKPRSAAAMCMDMCADMCADMCMDMSAHTLCTRVYTVARLDPPCASPPADSLASVPASACA